MFDLHRADKMDKAMQLGSMPLAVENPQGLTRWYLLVLTGQSKKNKYTWLASKKSRENIVGELKESTLSLGTISYKE